MRDRIAPSSGWRARCFRSAPYSLAAVSTMLALVACAPPAGDVLATWDGGEVAAVEVDALLRSLPPERRQPPPGETVEPWVEERITDLMLPELLLARARSSGLNRDPALLLRARYLAGEEIGRDYLRRRCPPEEVSEEELLAAFSASYPWTIRPWILVRHIYKEAPPTADPSLRQAARRAAGDLLDQLQAGASFIELARRHSDSETAEDGGLIGRISRDAPMDLLVRDAAWALDDGEVSGVIEVDDGFHIVFRGESGVEERPPLESVRQQLAQEQVLRRQNSCGRSVLAELGQQTATVLDHEALGASDPTVAVLTIGDEAFTLEQLDGLSPHGESLQLSERPGMVVRHFAESVILAATARAESEESELRYRRVEAATLDRLLVEAQRRAERRRLAESMPGEELRRYFEDHRERFTSDLELDIGMILVGGSGRQSRKKTLELAQKLHRRVALGESFETLAREQSTHPSRDQNGRLGSVPLPRLRVVLGSRGIVRASELTLGEVSTPVIIHEPPRTAYALLKLYGRTKPRPRSFEEARADVITALASEGVQQLDAHVRDQLARESGLYFRKRAIRAYLERLDG